MHYKQLNRLNLYNLLDLPIFEYLSQLEHYLNMTHENRHLDLYGKRRHYLFHGDWIGVNYSLYGILNAQFTQTYEL